MVLPTGHSAIAVGSDPSGVLSAVSMYDRVQREWARAKAELQVEIAAVTGDRRQALIEKLELMENTDMAVVVSPSHNEIAEMDAKGVDIRPHRERMVREDLATKFKDPDDPLRLVFVCAMWLTGFDAPATSTIYLDKPMRNHTLMQTIARANRVFQNKQAGEIIDYIGVFRNLQDALAIYGSASGGGVEEGDLPIEAKEVQAEELDEMLSDLVAWTKGFGVDLREGIGVSGFDWVAWLADAADAVLATDHRRKEFLARADMVAAKWKALKPHPSATDAQPIMSVILRLAQRVRMEIGSPDISGVMSSVEQLLEESVGAVPFVIDADAVERVDLTEIDFDVLAELFASGKKHTAATRLRSSLEQRLERMIRTNPTRIDYAEKLQEMIDRYNAGSANITTFFEELKALARSLTEEEQRHIHEQLTEEELAIFDLLTKPEPRLKASEEEQVKKVVRELLTKLKTELLVLDWKKRQATRAAVQVTIEQIFDAGLPDVYDRSIFSRKCAAVFEHIFTAYEGPGRSVYEAVA